MSQYADALRNLYSTGTVDEATASLQARLGTNDVAMADLTLLDDHDVPQISVSAPQSVQEGVNIVLSAPISPRADYPMSVTLAYNDPDGALTGTVPTQFQFSRRSFTTTATLSTLEDVIDTDPPDDETVTLTVSAPASAIIPANAVAATLPGSTTLTVRVLDDDRRPRAPVSLTAVAGDTVVDCGRSGHQPSNRLRVPVSDLQQQYVEPGLDRDFGQQLRYSQLHRDRPAERPGLRVRGARGERRGQGLLVEDRRGLVQHAGPR